MLRSADSPAYDGGGFLRIVVFGATGGCGRHIIERGLAAGHDITAVARHPEAIQPRERLEIVRGDVLDASSIEGAIARKDAVISALGAGYTRAPTSVCSAGVANIISAMHRPKVRRLVCISANGLETTANDPVLQRWILKPILQRVLREPYLDMMRMEEEIGVSGLDWTIVRPPRLTDTPPKLRYRSAINKNLRGAWSISRADLADFIIAHIDDPSCYRALVTVAY